MFVRLKDVIYTGIDFEQAHIKLFVYQEQKFDDYYQLLNFIKDDDLCYEITRILFGYLNRKKQAYTPDNINDADGYDIQWGLELVQKKIDIKIEYTGAISVLEFDSFVAEKTSHGKLGYRYLSIPQNIN